VWTALVVLVGAVTYLGVSAWLRPGREVSPFRRRSPRSQPQPQRAAP
jgi:hypothetical protein